MPRGELQAASVNLANECCVHVFASGCVPEISGHRHLPAVYLNPAFWYLYHRFGGGAGGGENTANTRPAPLSPFIVNTLYLLGGRRRWVTKSNLQIVECGFRRAPFALRSLFCGTVPHPCDSPGQIRTAFSGFKNRCAFPDTPRDCRPGMIRTSVCRSRACCAWPATLRAFCGVFTVSPPCASTCGLSPCSAGSTVCRAPDG